MDRLRTVLLILLLASCAMAVQPLDIPQPGLGGMISSGEIQPGQMRYGLNVDWYTHPGQLRLRKGMEYYGVSQGHTWGYHGYLDAANGWKFVVGIQDTLILWVDADTNIVSALVSGLFHSDTNRTTVSTGLDGYSFVGTRGDYDWTSYKGLLILADGSGVPVGLVAEGHSKMADSLPDTSTYDPRTVSMGLEAPGQLRVGIVDGGKVRGTYRYAYAYLNADKDTCSEMGLPSAPVYPDSQRVYLTQFDFSSQDTIDYILILRQKQDGRAQWMVLDTVSQSGPSYGVKVAMFTPFGKTSSQWPPPGDSAVYTCAEYSMSLTTQDSTTTREYTYWHSDDSVLTLSELWSWYVDTINADAIFGDSVVAELAPDIGGFIVRAAGLVGTAPDTATVDNFYASIVLSDYVGVSDNVNRCDGDSLQWYSFYTFYTPTPPTYMDTTADLQPIVYIDTCHDSVVTTQWDPSDIDTALQIPGQLYPDSFTVNYDSTSDRSTFDTTYWYAYSYYDPVLNVESPMGPQILTEAVDSTAEDSIAYRSLTTCVPAPGRPGWFRLYQGIVDSTVTGHGDTNYWWGLYEERFDPDTSAVTVYVGQWSDQDVAVDGLDTSTAQVATIYDYQVMRDVNGDPMPRPPYVYDLQVPFSTMAVAHYRVFGAGDPANPSRVYYSAVDSPYVWDPFNYFEIGNENGEAVLALESLDDQVRAFTTGGLWTLYQARQSLTLSATQQQSLLYQAEWVKEGAYPGTISRQTVSKYRDDIYWLTPDYEVWSYRKGLLSRPVHDRIDTLLGSRNISTVTSYARILCFSDQVHLVHDSTGLCLSYHIPSETWVNNEFVDFDPVGMFYYDSTSDVARLTNSEIVYDTASSPLMREYLTNTYADEAGDFDWAAEFFVGGDGFRNVTVEQVDAYLRGFNARNWFRYQVRGYRGDSLVADSMYYKLSGSAPYDESQSIRLHTIEHDPEKYIYLRLFGKDADSVDYLKDDVATTSQAFNRSWIEALRVYIRDHGTDIIDGTGDSVNETTGPAE